MAIAFVQARLGVAQVAPVSLAFTSALTAGNTAFVALGYQENGVRANGVTDSAGNVYSLVKRHFTPGGSNDRCVDLWQADGIVGGAATVTATFNLAKTGIGIGILEYSQTPGFILELDQDAEDDSTTVVTSYPHGSITTTQNVELILGVCNLGSEVLTASAGYTMRTNSGLAGAVHVCERITSTTVTTNPTPTSAGSEFYAAMVLSFYEAEDPSALKLTQLGRQVLSKSSVPAIKLTQMARQVLYPFTCDSGPPPVVPTPACPIDLSIGADSDGTCKVTVGAGSGSNSDGCKVDI